ncbi:hypothetical protein [Massilia phyllosphaerae]|uniref:hypothetical protein n=1 Tax=Massilia phyllosphaerae TaxID=3106034 RepID=UPI002B1CC3EA|nr:hypothetical protein [Massilia sp. SGZ-792]
MATAIFLFANTAYAGADIWGTVQRMQLGADGKIWFVLDSTDTATYCKSEWFEFNMYVPPDNPQYAYYYGILMTSLLKGKGVVVANISVFNATAACDITKTGYGIAILK